MQRREPVVHPFHHVARHVAKAVPVGLCRTDRMHLVIGIAAIPAPRRIPVASGRIHPFRLGRQAVRFLGRVKGQAFQIDTGTLAVEFGLSIDVGRIVGLLLAQFVRIQDGVVIRHVGRRQIPGARKSHLFACHLVLTDIEIVIERNGHRRAVILVRILVIRPESHGLSGSIHLYQAITLRRAHRREIQDFPAVIALGIGTAIPQQHGRAQCKKDEFFNIHTSTI